jgi:uncharacterized membrane-anchored protein
MQNSGVGSQLVGGIAAFALGVVAVAAIFQLNKGTIPSTAGTTTSKVVGDMFS